MDGNAMRRACPAHANNRLSALCLEPRIWWQLEGIQSPQSRFADVNSVELVLEHSRQRFGLLHPILDLAKRRQAAHHGLAIVGFL
jgi:hypothetical protein